MDQNSDTKGTSSPIQQAADGIGTAQSPQQDPHTDKPETQQPTQPETDKPDRDTLLDRNSPNPATYYSKKYPLDNPGEELGDNARVWRIYFDEAREIDEEIVNEYKESIDILLVFVR